mgnify:FL=1
MIEKIFVIYGLVLFLDKFFEKKGIWEWIQLKGSKSSSGTVFKLTSCRFCLLFHVSWIITFICSSFGLFGLFSWDVLIVPFVVSGLTYLNYKNGL